MRRSFLIPCILLLLSCRRDTGREQVDVSGITVKVPWERLESQIEALQNPNQLKELLRQHPVYTERFLGLAPDLLSSSTLDSLYAVFSHPEFKVLLQETTARFGDGASLKAELEEAFKHVKFYFPDFKIPRVQTVVTGFPPTAQGSDVFVSDSLILIGLDYFLGQQAKYRPALPQYLLRRYHPKAIVPLVVLGISQKYNLTNNQQDASLLADMVYHGKSLEFVAQILPAIPDSLITGYTSQQSEGLEANRSVVWAHFLDKKLLFESSPAVKPRYIGERPYTAEIGKEAPGAIGRWLGWEIVKTYRAKKAVALPQLMAQPDTRRIFNESGYRGGQ